MTIKNTLLAAMVTIVFGNTVIIAEESAENAAKQEINEQTWANPYTLKTPVKWLQHNYNMNTYGSQQASEEQQEHFKKALADMGIESSLPIYKSDIYGPSYMVTKTGIWLKDSDWRDNGVQGPTYRHYYLAAHLKNGTLPQHQESEDEKHLKVIACGLIPGPSMLFGAMKLNDNYFLKGGKRSMAMWPLLIAGGVLSQPLGILASGILLRLPTLTKREKIEDSAKKLAIETIEKNYNGRDAFKMTERAPRFRAY